MTTVISAGGAGIPATYGTVRIGNGGTVPSGMTGSTGSIFSVSGFDMEDFLDTHSFNKITVEHKVAEFELAKLKETVPTYADEIKENLSKNLARDIIKKTTFTKKHNVDSDTHHFLGRVWVFTEDELKNLIQGVRNA
jgi:hypothetical protein